MHERFSCNTPINRKTMKIYSFPLNIYWLFLKETYITRGVKVLFSSDNEMKRYTDKKSLYSG